jgi:hypothetical protein
MHAFDSPRGERTGRRTALLSSRKPLARCLTVAGVALVALVAAPAAHAADLQATPSNLASVFASAKAGDTINLASGSYGAFKGGQKAGEVVLKPQSGATATMNTTLTDNQNVTFDGVKFGGLKITGSATKNVAVRNGDFTGAQLTLMTGTLQNANIDIANNRFVNTNPCSGCGKGRVYLPNRVEGTQSGITIRNNFFSGGASDGILNGSNGTRILNNEFTNLVQGDPSINHTDAIQLYGSKNTVVRGNYFHGVEDCIMAPDGVDHETIDGNVCVVSGSQFGFTLGSDNGSVISHNTVPNRGIRACQQKSGAPAPKGTVVRDNITSTIYCEVSSGLASEDYNLVADGSRKAAHDLTGKPTYVAGTSPTTMPGFALTSSSMGKAKASDGTDIGGVQTSSVSPSPTPTPTPSPTPTPTPAAPTAAFTWSPTAPLTGQVVHFDGRGSSCAVTPCTYAWEDDGGDGAGGTQWPLGSGPTLDFTFKGTGTKHVRLTVKDAQARTATVEHDVVVK